jgi:hypothetical protein
VFFVITAGRKIGQILQVLESMKSQTPSTKPGPRPEGGDSEGEITNKSQIPISNDQNRFGIFSHCSRLPQEGKEH